MKQLKKKENADAYVDRAIDSKLMQALKTMVTLKHKAVTLDKFNKLMRGEQ